MRPRHFASGVLMHACFVLPAQAQTPHLEPVQITGNPLRGDGIAAPTSALYGTDLVLGRGSSLGDTLSGVPGVSMSYFGPNANRPIIRGLDGDRVRILNNDGATLDASGLSFDHAVPLDPLAVERIDVLRGPAALLYGGGAIGGVVNVIDNRIPEEPIDSPRGVVEVRHGGAARERGGSALVEAGGEGFAIHADAFARRTGDLRVPTFERSVDGSAERRDRVLNSAADAEGGALGASWLWEQGHLGVAIDSYRNDYGIVAEDDVTIRMRRDKVAVAGEHRDPEGRVRVLRGRLQFTDYEHREFEGGDVGTTFENKGYDLRIEAEHAAIGPLRGVLGFQAEEADFEAIGDEAFVPSSRTRQVALFMHEELRSDDGQSHLSAGGRLERHRITAKATPGFGPARARTYTAASAALGGALGLGAGWRAHTQIAWTERAPTNYELYADGLHIATAAYERGDASLREERGTNLDAALEWRDGAQRLRLGAFASRYTNYLALLPTGDPDHEADGEFFPVYAYRGVKARFWGIELEGTHRVLDGAYGRLDADAQFDLVRARNQSHGEPLPRIAPQRGQLRLTWTHQGWTLAGEVVRASAQHRVPANDMPTPAYTLVHMRLAKQFTLGDSEMLAFLRIDNLGNERAYNAASIATIRRLAPLPGRSLLVGLRCSF